MALHVRAQEHVFSPRRAQMHVELAEGPLWEATTDPVLERNTSTPRFSGRPASIWAAVKATFKAYMIIRGLAGYILQYSSKDYEGTMFDMI